MKPTTLTRFLLVLLILFLVACSSTTENTPTNTPEVAEVAEDPTDVPTEEPTDVPTEVPTEEPTDEPTEVPTEEPTLEPTPSWVAPEGALVSYPVTEVPVLDGAADEAAWAGATALQIEVGEGVNDAPDFVEIRSVYTEDTVYFVVTWSDPTQSYLRSPWVKQEDGSWLKLADPDDKGGDNNLYYEDKLAFIWSINDSIVGFVEQGCGTACHEGQDSEFKPYGNKYTDGEGQWGDIWHWKSVRNVGQIDDQYLDWTEYSADTPESGRHSDPKDSGGYYNNESEDKTVPAWMGPAGSSVDGSPGFLLESDIVPFDDSLFVAGDMIPSIVVAPIVGDRGDIAAAWQWVDGVWTIEFSRALDTGSEFDVQFADLAQTYFFGVAVFENAQVRHAYQEDATMFVFMP